MRSLFAAILTALCLVGAQISHAVAHGAAPHIGHDLSMAAADDGVQCDSAGCDSHGNAHSLHIWMADHTHDSPVAPSTPAGLVGAAVSGWDASAVVVGTAVRGGEFDRPPRYDVVD